MTTGLVLDAIFKDHLTRYGHPECPSRLDAVRSGIGNAANPSSLRHIQSRAASEEQILRCHSAAYVETVRADIRAGNPFLSTGDTDLCARSLDVALIAAGSAAAAVDAVFAGQVTNAFCALRPPGHHATRDRGMGFCIFNNAAIAARHAQSAHGVERVLIADWDVHHGNGTQDIFYEDPTVFYFSTHQWPSYPGTGTIHETGAGKGKGFTLNCPLPAGACREDVLNAFTRFLVPAMKRFAPEFLVISAGFDGRRGDLLGHLCLEDEDFADLTVLILNLAETYAGGRVVSVLEGGYELAGLASSVGTHVRALTQVSAHHLPSAPRTGRQAAGTSGNLR